MALAKHSDTFSENQGNTFSRRNFLTTAPAFSFASLMASGATAADETDSEIMRLYREWHVLDEWVEGPATNGVADDEIDQACDELRAIERRMMAIPATTAAEFAAKVVVNTCKGRCLDDWESGALGKEARRLVGSGA